MEGLSMKSCLLTVAFAIGIIAALPLEGFALITGGEGNEPLADPGWPKNAAAVFNTPSRIAYWEGPPFGGGQYHAECRGDAAALNQVLIDFEKVESKRKRVIFVDGPGSSFWLGVARGENKDKPNDASMDWEFTVWSVRSYDQYKSFPSRMRAPIPEDEANEPIPTLQIHCGGNIRFEDVKTPSGLEVIDQRLEAHGFRLEDGNVLEGVIARRGEKNRIAALITIEQVKPLAEGGYEYIKIAETRADDAGHWLLKNVDKVWSRAIASADGFSPRVLGYNQISGAPRWRDMSGFLAPEATIRGRVVDEQGNPLGGVSVHLDMVDPGDGNSYETSAAMQSTTESDGTFSLDHLPVGRTRVWAHKAGYVRPGLGLDVSLPASDVELTMQPSSSLHVEVKFAGAGPSGGYLVHFEPVGGAKVGAYSGSANIDPTNQVLFTDVPAGEYVVYGRPNPGGDEEQTEKQTIKLSGGQQSDVVIQAKR